MNTKRIVSSAGRVAVGVTLIGPLLLALAGPALAAKGGNPQASITLTNCNSDLCNANNTAWSLDKTTPSASVEGDNTINWTVTANPDGTTDNFLSVDGVITITNTGTASATIGNIVVNLQKPATKNPQKVAWVSAAADCADATSGDVATMCNIVAAASAEDPTVNAAQGPPNYTVTGAQGTFKETSASSTLEFTDADMNTAFSLTPEVMLQPNHSITLLYTAKFDNTVLGLAAGSQVRAEALVTFGNAGLRGGSGATATNIDIDGDGVINTTDEANVRTVPCRVTKSIPALQNGNATVTLSDTVDDVTVANDTVIVSNFSTNIGLNDTGSGESVSTSTTRSVSVDEMCTPPGSATITNTAHLDGQSSSVTVQGPQIGTDPITGQPIYQQFTFACVTGVDLEKASDVGVSCDAELPQTPNVCTYSKGGYSAPCNGGNPGCLFDSNYIGAFPNGLTIGIEDNAGPEHDADWTDDVTGQTALKAYLGSSAGGTSTALTADTANATSTSGAELPRQTATLALNIGFAIINTSFPSLPATPLVDSGGFGDLELCNLAEGTAVGAFTLTAAQAAALNGKTVSQVLADANNTLGDGNVCSNNAAITCDPSSSAPAIHTLCVSSSAQCVAKTLPAYAGSAGDLNQLVSTLNLSFDDCVASAFASANICQQP